MNCVSNFSMFYVDYVDYDGRDRYHDGCQYNPAAIFPFEFHPDSQSQFVE